LFASPDCFLWYLHDVVVKNLATEGPLAGGGLANTGARKTGIEVEVEEDEMLRDTDAMMGFL
jgi:hypothetical protein